MALFLRHTGKCEKHNAELAVLPVLLCRDVLAAQLGGGTRAAPGNSSSAAPGPWGAPSRPSNVRPLADIMQEETAEELEGGAVEEEGLEELMAGLRQRNQQQAAAAPPRPQPAPAAAAPDLRAILEREQKKADAQKRQQQQAAAAAAAAHVDEEPEMFWEYNPTPSPAPVKAQPQRAAVIPPPVPVVARVPNTAGPAPVAPPAKVAGPWAKASAVKQPPPGQVKPAAAAPSAAAVAARAGAQQAAAAVGGGGAKPAAAAAARQPASGATAVNRGAAAAGNGNAAPSRATAAAGRGAANDSGLFTGALELSSEFAGWCRSQMLLLQGNDDLTMVELLMSTDSNSEVAEYAQMVWAGKPGAQDCWSWSQGGGGMPTVQCLQGFHKLPG